MASEIERSGMEENDKILEAIQTLIKPKSIAIIGASENTRTLNWLLAHHYPGKIFPVNPKYKEIKGINCYSSLKEIPDAIDTALILVSSKTLANVLSECVEKRVRSATIYAAGFADMGAEGKVLQDRLLRFARENGLRLVGPNALGVLNIKDMVTSGISSILVEKSSELFPGNVGIVAQSGGLGDSLLTQIQSRGAGVSYHFQTGNEADLETADFMRFLLNDDDTRVIMAYIEGFKNGPLFIKVAEEAAKRKKPIILYKVGRSGLGAKAAATHTGSSTGSDLVHDKLFKQKGVIRVNDVSDLIETVFLFSRYVDHLPKGNRIGIISASGGVKTLLADKGGELGLNLPELSFETQKQIKETLRFVTISNPLDLTGEVLANSDLLNKFLRIFMNDPNLDLLLYGFGLATGRDLPQKTTSALIEEFQATKKPVVALMIGASAASSGYEVLEKHGIPLFKESVEKCLRSIKSLVDYKVFLDRQTDTCSQPQMPGMPSEVKKSSFIDEFSGLDTKTLTEHMSKRLLAAYEIPVTQERIATTLDEAVEAAAVIGYPLVVKINSPDIAHKTEAKGVVLGIKDKTALVEAYQNVMTNARRYNPKALINGVLIQEMAQPGTEVIAGIMQDPHFGPTIMFGLGGIFTEVLKDISCRVAPLSFFDAEEMIREIKGFKILAGFRGRPKADMEAIVAVLLKLSKLSLDFKGIISEVDINPLVVFEEGQGVKALDALVVLK